MRKIISILLVLMMSLVALTGCSTSNLTSNSNSKKLAVTGDCIKNSSGKEYFEKLCKSCNIEVTEPTEMADSWNYENSNSITNIQVNSLKDTDEIYYIKIMALQETNLNDFLSACDIGFNDYDAQAKSWVEANINTKSIKTFNRVYYKIEQNLNKPTLEIYTFYGKVNYEKQETKSVKQ